MLIKIWLEVGQEEQERRFAARVDDPMRQWKLSPMDVEVLPALVRLLTRARRHAEGDRHQARALVHRAHLTTSDADGSIASPTSSARSPTRRSSGPR